MSFQAVFGAVMSAREFTYSEIRTWFETAASGKILFDHELKVREANKIALGILGYSRVEVLGRSIDFLIPGGDRKHHAKLVRKYLANPDIRPMGEGRDLWALRKDDLVVPVEIGLEQVSVDKRVHTIATLLDISERKRREVSQIASASARGRIQACEELGVPAVVLTLDGSVIEANHRYHEFAGYWVNSAPFLRALGQLKLEPKTRLLFIPASERQPSVVAHLVPVAETSPPVLQDGLLVVAIFSVLSTATGISTAALIHIFGLTPAEARVAVCCRMGLRVSEISTKLDLSKETIRTELAHIFAKTGVSSQTELAALLGRIRVSEDTHWG